MGKAAIGLGILIIGATASAPFAMTWGSGSDGEVTEDDIIPSTPSDVPPETPKTNVSKIPTLSKTSDIKNQYLNTECLQEFKEGDGNPWQGNNEQLTSATPSLSSINQSSEDLKGCLVVEHYKQTKGDKWKGEFKLVWSLSNSSERFVTVFIANTNSSSLMLETSIYIMNKSESSWSISYQKEDVNQMVIKDEDLNDKFPKSSSSTKDNDSDDYWGFNPEINKICGDECSKMIEVGTTISKKWTWSKDDSTGTSITDFSSNFDSWFKKPFGSQEITIDTTLKGIKGKWSLKSQ